MEFDKKKLRSADQPLPSVYVVAPDGRIMTCYFGHGVNNRIVNDHGRIRQECASEGYLLLKRAYLEDEETGEEGWRHWLECQRARRRKQDAKLPDSWLPRIVLERREAKRREVWEPPPPPPKRRLPRNPEVSSDAS